MTSDATILLADISGFTDFVSSTEIEHSAHIVNELLELLVASNELGLTVSEIEGDAILFYKTGEPVPAADMVNQCLTMFRNFHKRLRIIERDAICQCGACQGTSGLGLKFIVHHGTIKEIKVANFTKASGLDMIIAHRLLKNEVPAREYLLTTTGYVNEPVGSNGLSWMASTQRYKDVGDIATHYALLDEIRAGIPDPPARRTAIMAVSDDSLRGEIAAPLVKVYMKIIDVEGKKDWVVGLDGIEREKTTPRIEETHTCYFQGMKVDFRLLHSELKPDSAIYLEEASFDGTPFSHQQMFTMERLDDRKTSVTFSVQWQDDPPTPDEMRQMYLSGVGASFENFRTQVEQK